NGTRSYGFDASTAYNAQVGDSDWQDYSGFPSEQQVVGVEAASDEWQWVQDTSSAGYYYNSVTGEARWDNPAAVHETNSQALVERGYRETLAGRGVTTAATAGEDNYSFTAEDGTVWSYDEALGDYVQQHNQPDESADSKLFRLNPAAGSPWQRVESEHGPYYYNILTEESSWNPPPKWAESPTTGGDDYGGKQLDESDNGFAEGLATTRDDAGKEGGDNYHTPLPQNASVYVASGSISVQRSLSDIGQSGGDGGGGDGDGTERRPQGASSSGGGERDASSGNGNNSRSGSGIFSLDHTSADEFSQWSLEKLRDVSKTLPGRWVISDFLMNRATEDYDTMLTLSAAEIEEIKSKGTSRIVRSLVGPEDGEDSDEDALLLPLSSDEEPSDFNEVPLTSSISAVKKSRPKQPIPTPIPIASLVGVTPAPQPQQSPELAPANGGSGGGSTAVRRQKKSAIAIGGDAGSASKAARRPSQRMGQRVERRRSLLGLEQSSSSVVAEGGDLGGWKSGIALDGSMYFIHEDTGESRWTFPVRPWEIKARQLALLTPRAPTEVGRGTFRLRETDEMKKKRLEYRWKVETVLAQEVARRKDNPTEAEAAEAALDKIIHIIERREHRKRRRMERNVRALERARWNPSTLGFLMQRLVVPSSTTAIAAARWAEEKERGRWVKGTEKEQETKMVLTDASFVNMKLTQGGSAVPWGQETTRTSSAATINTAPHDKPQGRTLTAALQHFGLSTRLLQQRGQGWLSLPTDVRLPTLPSFRALGGVRSLGDLKHELAAAGVAARFPKMNVLAKEVGQGKAAADTEAAVVGGGAEMTAAAEGETPAPKKATANPVDRDETSEARESPADTVAVGEPSARSGNVFNAADGTVDDARTSHKMAGGSSASMLWGKKRSRGSSSSSSSRNNAGESREVSPTNGGDSGTDGRYLDSAKASFPPMTTATAAGLEGQTELLPRVTGSAKAGNEEVHSGQQQQQQQRQQQQGGSPSLVTLTAVGTHDKQVRGLGAKLALKIEGGQLDPSRASVTATAIAKRTLVAAGKAIGIPNKRVTAAEVRDKTGRSLTPQPPPPDVSTVTIELACKPPPFNLLTTASVKDPASGKMYDREELTSELRDAWESMIIRDIATAGGVDPRQVSIETVWRRSRSNASVPTSASPFRPERRDETQRRLVAAVPARPGRPAAPVQACFSNTAAAAPVLDGRRSTKSGHKTEPPPMMATAISLPPAGVSAAFTRRLRTPVAKKRRLGGNWGGSNGCSGGGRGGGDQAGRMTRLFENRGAVNEPTTDVDGGRRPVTARAPASPTTGADAAVVPVARSSTQEVLRPHIIASRNGSSSPGVCIAEQVGREGEGVGNETIRRIWDAVKDGDPWKKTNFADINVMDDHAVGIGAGNRGDFGILGRIQQRGEGPKRILQHMEQIAFEPIDEGRTQNPE
ncbi:unnamed protein product, partial [Pylaiella littoralis]